MCVVSALCVSVWFRGGNRGSRGILDVTPLVTVVIPGATWHAPWRGRIRL